MSKSLQDLIPVILAKTKEKKIPWKTETDEMFSAALGPERTLVVYEIATTFRLSLRGPTNAELEGVSSYDLFMGNTDIKEIYSLARRQALGVDKAIEDVEQTLLSL
jgi:hypothetical protein